MITFRHHVVSIVAVFLALAVGIALGGGPLGSAESVDGTGDRAGGSPTSADTAGGTDATSGAEASYAEKFVVTGAPQLYADGLAGGAVALVAMPSADKDVLRDLSTQIQAAGGRVTGRYGVREDLLDPAQRSLADTLGSQLITQLSDADLDASAPTYERIGQVLGVAVATTGTAASEPTQSSLTARDTLSGAELISTPSVDVASAPLVLLVLGPEAGVDQAAVDIQSALVAGLAGTVSGVVVAGDEASAEDGTLAAVRAQEVSGVLATVDGVDSSLGRVSTVLALIGARSGRGGAFGAASADSAVPLG